MNFDNSFALYYLLAIYCMAKFCQWIFFPQVSSTSIHYSANKLSWTSNSCDSASESTACEQYQG